MMKIGIFDSGLGGLIVARAIRQRMPQYDYVYLGDTKRVPYGNRSHGTIFEFAREGIDHLFRKEKCGIVIVACNTVSARALRKLQQEYLPKNFPGKKILGVLIPAAEAAARLDTVGVIGTVATVTSNAFPDEIRKLNAKTKVFQNPAPMLVPLAESGEKKRAAPFIREYLRPLAEKKIKALVLGCTHYPAFKKEIRAALPKGVKIISQDDIVPGKLENYLARHPEIGKRLSRKRTVKILVTDTTSTIDELARTWFGKIKPKMVKL